MSGIKNRFPVLVLGLILWGGSFQGVTAQSVLELASKSESEVQFLSPIPIRVSSNLVSVPVSVTDNAGQVIKNLDVLDFRIEEDGSPIPISKMAEASQSPLNLALLFDLSGSVKSRFEFERLTRTSPM